MKKAFVFALGAWAVFAAGMALFPRIFCERAFADRVTLDTGNALEGMAREENDHVALRYFSLGAGKYSMKTITIPRARIKAIDRDPSYFEKYRGLIKGLESPTAGVSTAAVPAPAVRTDDSLTEAIHQGNAQVQENLEEQQRHMRDTKFYNGWHEGYHWDPINGWHRHNHEGLYDPKDSNIKARE